MDQPAHGLSLISFADPFRSLWQRLRSIPPFLHVESSIYDGWSLRDQITHLKVGGGPGNGGGGTGLASGNLLVVGNRCRGCGTGVRNEVVGGWKACA